MKKIKRLNKAKDNYSPISLSIGVYENVSYSIDDCIKNVDNAMYKSKTNGKNQINIIKSSA